MNQSKGRWFGIVTCIAFALAVAGYVFVFGVRSTGEPDDTEVAGQKSSGPIDIRDPVLDELRPSPNESSEGQSVIRIDVVDDSDARVSDFGIYASADGLEWYAVAIAESGLIEFPESAAYVFIASAGHLSRLRELSLVREQRSWTAVLPRLPKVTVGMENGANLRLAGAELRVIIETGAFPDPQLRFPLRQSRVLPTSASSNDGGPGESKFVADLQSYTGSRDYTIPDNGFIALDDVVPWFNYKVLAHGYGEHNSVTFAASPGEELHLVVPFGPGPFIRGRVLDELGNPVAGAAVTPYVEKRNEKGHITHRLGIGVRKTNESGYFLILPLAKLPGGHEYDEVFDISVSAIVQRQHEVAIGSASVRAVLPVTEIGNVIVGGRGVLEGKVLQDGVPVPGVSVTLVGRMMPVECATDRGGYFRIAGVDMQDDSLILHASFSPPWQADDWFAAQLRAAIAERTPIVIEAKKPAVAAVNFGFDGASPLDVSWFYRPVFTDEQRAMYEIAANPWQVSGPPLVSKQYLEPREYEWFLIGDGQYVPIQRVVLRDRDEFQCQLVWRPAATIHLDVDRGVKGNVEVRVLSEDGERMGYLRFRQGAPADITVLPGRVYRVAVRLPGDSEETLFADIGHLGEGSETRLKLQSADTGKYELKTIRR